MGMFSSKKDKDMENFVQNVDMAVNEMEKANDISDNNSFRNLSDEEILSKIIEHYTSMDKKSLNLVDRGLLSKEDFLDQVRVFLRKNGCTEEQVNYNIVSFSKYIWGYHVLDDLLYDDQISDIKVLNDHNVRVKRNGKREDTDIKFSSEKDYVSFVNYVAIKNKVNISDINAIQTFTDKETNPNFILRFNIMNSLITSTGMPYLQIRKIPKNKYSMDKLVKLGMMDESTKDYLIDKAENATGILFTGKGASGKTTMMNALIEKIPHDKSGLVIQENEELFSNEHPELMFEHIVTNSGESKIQYDLSEIGRNGLLIDLDYFIIGEIKGGEALYFLNAEYTGHKAWASVHGNSATQAIDKLADYVKYSSDYTKPEIMKMLSNIQVVVFMKDFKVQEIVEVESFDENKNIINYKKIL